MRGGDFATLGIPFQTLEISLDLGCVLIPNIAIFFQCLADDLPSFDGVSGFNLTIETGALLRIESKITPDVSPRKGNVPVVIS